MSVLCHQEESISHMCDMRRYACHTSCFLECFSTVRSLVYFCCAVSQLDTKYSHIRLLVNKVKSPIGIHLVLASCRAWIKCCSRCCAQTAVICHTIVSGNKIPIRIGVSSKHTTCYKSTFLSV